MGGKGASGGSGVPSSERLGREPAQYGRQVLRRKATSILVAVAVLVAATVLLWLVVGLDGWALIAVELGLIAALILIERRTMPELDRRERGNEGELHVAAILDGLAEDGWRTLHDVSLGRGNVDHVVVGPGGVLTVETKSHGGRIRTADIDGRWLSQAYAQRKLIERITGLEVDSLLVFSRAFLVGRPVSRQRGVLVLPARMLAGHLARREPVLSAERVDAVHRQLASALADQTSARA